MVVATAAGQSHPTQFCCWGEFFYEERKARTDLSSFVSRTSFICLSQAKYPQLYFCGISSKMKRKKHFWGLVLYNQKEYLSFSLKTQNPGN